MLRFFTHPPVHHPLLLNTFFRYKHTINRSPIFTYLNLKMKLLNAFLFAIAQSTASLVAAAATDRATWLWDATLFQDNSKVSKFLTFAVSKGVKKVYAGVNADVPNAAFGSFISQCSAKGIAVGALIGNSQWILDQGSPSIDDNLSWIEQYQASAAANAKFKEVHMDIEVRLECFSLPMTHHIPGR